MNQEIELSPLRLDALEHGFIGELQISIAMFDLRRRARHSRGAAIAETLI
ncbi:hypothetical protein GGD66_000851 [Bradyrhizobium sp. CIR48]|nr:hypothetical protein [Bradyrhizobium sp. CIR48]MBB4422325.1 hypothetical protein [Bradyrhizobium sp. CIR48]